MDKISKGLLRGPANNLLERKGANRIRIGFLAAFILLLLSNLLSFVSTSKVNEQSAWVNHTNKVIHDLDNLLSFVTRAESSFRGYLIDKDKSQIEIFNQSVQRIDSVMNVLRNSTSDNPRQQENINEIKLRLNDAVFSLEKRIQNFQKDNLLTNDIIEENAKANILLITIETKVHQMQEEERKLWNERSEKISNYSELIKYLSVISIIIAILLTLYSILVFNKENQGRKEADEKALELRQQLENRVKELADLNSELIELRSLEKYAVTGRIARTIAHEVRNPLTNINLALEQLRSDIVKDDSSDMFFDMINRNSERINRLVSDLLNSTRMTEVNRKPASPNEILEECLAEAHDRIMLKHIKVVKNLNPDICTIDIDKEKVKIAFLNLIVNAIEAMEDGGTLTISTWVDKNKCHISITDTGHGMSKDQMGRLFEPFFTTKPKGNGLGLANAQNIILSHNGVIKAESEEGKGTTFLISFDMD